MNFTSKIWSIALCLTLAGVAQAQDLKPFRVLSNNSDLQNKKLYVELMYQKPACGAYQAKFRLEDKSGVSVPLRIDSVMNNPDTYVLSNDKRALKSPLAGGYRLRFDLTFLPGGAGRFVDSLKVYVESSKLAYTCRGCGSGGSDVIFGPDNVKPGCPYEGSDILACHLRTGVVGNWEAWIQDPRDCKPYRIVRMPDNRWWFAQNLDFREELWGYNNAADLAGTDGRGAYWCPGDSGATLSFNVAGCKTYGALYTWATVMSANGRNLHYDSVPFDRPSDKQGICPEGWLVPGFYDWGVMLNAAEGQCPDPTADAAAPCNHLSLAVGAAGERAGKYLKNTLSCKVTVTGPFITGLQPRCADATRPAWSYYLDDGKIMGSTRIADDRYGFGMLAAGRRYATSPTTGSFDKIPGVHAFFWTSSRYESNNGAVREFNAAGNTAYFHGDDAAWDLHANALPLRCIAAQQ